MFRYFAIFHGLHERAPWGVAVERESGSPRVELLMLCRTEQEAGEHAKRTSLGHSLEEFRDQQIAAREERGVAEAGAAT